METPAWEGDIPEWDDAPEEMKEHFAQVPGLANEEGWNRWARESNEQRRDMAFDMESKVVGPNDLKQIAELAEQRDYNRQLPPEIVDRIDPHGTNVLKPLLIHRHAEGVEVPAHMRVSTFIKLVDRTAEEPWQGTIDVPMEHWNLLATLEEFQAAMDGTPEEELARQFTNRLFAAFGIGPSGTRS